MWGMDCSSCTNGEPTSCMTQPISQRRVGCGERLVLRVKNLLTRKPQAQTLAKCSHTLLQKHHHTLQTSLPKSSPHLQNSGRRLLRRTIAGANTTHGGEPQQQPTQQPWNAVRQEHTTMQTQGAHPLQRALNTNTAAISTQSSLVSSRLDARACAALNSTFHSDKTLKLAFFGAPHRLLDGPCVDLTSWHKRIHNIQPVGAQRRQTDK